MVSEFWRARTALMRFTLLDNSLRWTLFCPDFCLVPGALGDRDGAICSQLSALQRNTGCAASIGSPASPKTPNGPPFWAPFSLGMGTFQRSWGSNFRCIKNVKVWVYKKHRNHTVDRPKMHVVWYILFQEFASHQRKSADRQNSYFLKFRAPSFLYCVFYHLRHGRQKKKRQGASFQGFWDFLTSIDNTLRLSSQHERSFPFWLLVTAPLSTTSLRTLKFRILLFWSFVVFPTSVFNLE